jgi:type II secretory pathway pseudopilin PulG
MKTVSQRLRTAFSIVEVLVVMTVVAILVAILLPVLQGAKERGKRIVCMSQEHQILLAMTFYSEDHDGRLPQQANYGPDWSPWTLYLTNYVKGIYQVFRCPSDRNMRRPDGANEPWRSYAVNSVNGWSAGYKVPWPTETGTPYKLADVPSHVLLIGENHGIDDSGGTPCATILRSELEGLKGIASAQHRVPPRKDVPSELDYSGGGNYGFPDGRVEFHKCVDYLNPNPSFTGDANDPWKWQ